MQRENMDAIGIQKQEQVKLPSNVTRTRSGGANQIEKFNIFLFHTLSIVVEIYLLSNIFKEKKNLHTDVSKICIIN